LNKILHTKKRWFKGVSSTKYPSKMFILKKWLNYQGCGEILLFMFFHMLLLHLLVLVHVLTYLLNLLIINI
jgi:hypothetical protein